MGGTLEAEENPRTKPKGQKVFTLVALGRSAGQGVRCPQEEWVGMGSCSFASQWSGVGLGALSAGSGVALVLVSGPLCTPPEFILEVLKFMTQQGQAEEDAWWREEAGLAAEAALSPSRAPSPLGERALVSNLWASCSSASRSRVSAWGCRVGPSS